MCIFCEIVKGNIPCFKLYENKSCICFLDISQATKGHTLVVLKRHAKDFFEVSSDEYNDILEAAKVVSSILKEKLGVENFNYLNNCGELAGQSVMHYHLHVIPRYENDHVTIQMGETSPSMDELKETFELLSK